MEQLRTADGQTDEPVGEELTTEDYAEIRAYLQRAETRLSTSHRVAGSFISGAGLLTLLPLLISGTFSTILGMTVFYSVSGIPRPQSWERWLALAPAVISITLPIAALYLLIRDLIKFYFTARSFSDDLAQQSTVYPRFILSGIRVSDQSLSDVAKSALKGDRGRRYVQQLVVPAPAEQRAAMLREAKRSGALPYVRVEGTRATELQSSLLEYAFESVGAEIRSITEEGAKMEASLVRHQRMLRGLVLRYGKAFLLTIVTAVCCVAVSGALTLLRPVDGGYLDVNPRYVWLCALALYSAWSLAAAVVIRRPVEWLYADIASDKAKRTPLGLLRFEQATLLAALACGCISVLDAVWFVAFDHSANAAGQEWIIVVSMLGVFAFLLRRVYDGFKSEWQAGSRAG